MKKSLFYSAIFLWCMIVTIFLAGCGTPKDGPPKRHIDVNKIPDAVPRQLPRSRYGNSSSYKVLGKRYYVRKKCVGYDEKGIASWYGTKFNGKLTSSREPYDLYGMTAASTTLPLPCFVRVINLENGRSVVVKVNDRGPFAKNRIIDLSYAAAKKLGVLPTGTALVRVIAIDPREYETNANMTPVSVLTKPKLYLQVGAFRNKDNAQSTARRVDALTPHPVVIERVRKKLSSIYRVQIGPLNGVEESDELKEALDEAGYHESVTVIK